VLRADGTVIPGLLAAGGTVVGISGHGAAGYSSGNGLAQAFVLGMIAADTIVAQIQSAARKQCATQLS
jgi:fumarate reductase flavoprotein subunit